MKADGVFSGGGVKGIAFAGAIAAAEEAGYDQWQRLAGTSAGAIAAMALAAGYDARGIRDALAATDYREIAKPFNLFGRARNLVTRRGLSDGERLETWIGDLLGNAPSPVTEFGELEGRLRVVGCDLAHSRLVVFPDDVGLYENPDGKAYEPDRFSVARAVRISAGYPYFFSPVAMRDRATGKDGVMVDGGVVSSFPVFLFDRPDPSHPTWGFRLHSGLGAKQPAFREISGVDWPVDMAWGILDTAMNAFDSRDLFEFGDRAVSIPTGSVDTLDFDLSAAEQSFLYQAGYDAAGAFFAGDPTGRNSLGAVPPTG